MQDEWFLIGDAKHMRPPIVSSLWLIRCSLSVACDTVERINAARAAKGWARVVATVPELSILTTYYWSIYEKECEGGPRHTIDADRAYLEFTEVEHRGMR